MASIFEMNCYNSPVLVNTLFSYANRLDLPTDDLHLGIIDSNKNNAHFHGSDSGNWVTFTKNYLQMLQGQLNSRGKQYKYNPIKVVMAHEIGHFHIKENSPKKNPITLMLYISSLISAVASAVFAKKGNKKNQNIAIACQYAFLASALYCTASKPDEIETSQKKEVAADTIAAYLTSTNEFEKDCNYRIQVLGQTKYKYDYANSTHPSWEDRKAAIEKQQNEIKTAQKRGIPPTLDL